MYLYSKMLLSLYKEKVIICQPNFQTVIHLLKRLDPNKHLDSQMWGKRKEDAEISLTLGISVPKYFGLTYLFSSCSLSEQWTELQSSLEGFLSVREKKEKLRPTWECICFECLLPALSDVWPYAKQKGILDVDSLSDPSPWSKTYSQHVQTS